MTRSIVLPVEELTVDLVQVFHSLGEVCVRRFYHQVVVISHEAVDMAQPVISFDGFIEKIEVLDTVLIFKKDHLSFIAPAYDMVKSTFELDP